MRKKKMSIQEANNLDMRLQSVVAYEVSGGMIFIPDSAEAYMSHQKKIATQFNRYKRLIQLGELTIEDIERTVLENNSCMKLPSKKSPEQVINEEIQEVQAGRRDIEDIQSAVNIINLSMQEISKRAAQVAEETGEPIEKVLGIDKMLDRIGVHVVDSVFNDSIPPLTASGNSKMFNIPPSVMLEIEKMFGYGSVDGIDESNVAIKEPELLPPPEEPKKTPSKRKAVKNNVSTRKSPRKTEDGKRKPKNNKSKSSDS